MITLLSLKSTFAILLIILFAGCAGITEVKLTETEITFDNTDIPVVHSELPEFFDSGDDGEIITSGRRDRYHDRQ